MSTLCQNCPWEGTCTRYECILPEEAKEKIREDENEKEN